MGCLLHHFLKNLNYLFCQVPIDFSIYFFLIIQMKSIWFGIEANLMVIFYIHTHSRKGYMLGLTLKL